jgi:hypothetical protein
MDTCVCGRKLVCSKCREISDRCKCEEETGDYSLVEAKPMTSTT